MKRPPNKVTLLLACVLLAAGVFRFYGLTVGFPFETHVDEWFIVRSTLEMYRTGALRPPAFDYPSLVYYLLLACAHVIGLFKEPQSFDLHVAGRALSALAGTATVAVVFLTGRRAYGARAGLLAAALYAFTVTAVRESHYYTTDSVNTLCIALAVYFAVRVALGDAARNYLYAGVSIGLAAGSKYNGAFLILPLALAHALRAARDAGSWRASLSGPALRRTVFSRHLFVAGLLALAVFFCTTPYALIDHAAFLKDLTKISGALTRNVVEANHHYIGTTPYWYYVENLLFWAMNPALEAACLAGLAYALWRRRAQDLVVACWVLVYFWVVGGWLNKAVRYTLPMLPFLTLFAAAMFVETSTRLGERGRPRAARVVNVLAALVLASAFLYTLAYARIYARPHTHLQAARWVYENAPRGATILLEDPTPQERPPVDAQVLVGAGSYYTDAARRYRFSYLNVADMSRRDADESALRAKVADALARADYVVMSMRWYEGLARSPEASAVAREYYGALLSGESGFEPAAEFVSYPGLFGLDLVDDRAELNFRVFDHPKVWIFRRKAGGVQRR